MYNLHMQKISNISIFHENSAEGEGEGLDILQCLKPRHLPTVLNIIVCGWRWGGIPFRLL